MIRDQGGGSRVRILSESIEYGDVSLPPKPQQRKAMLAIASVAGSAEELNEVLVILGLKSEYDLATHCAKGHRLNRDGKCVRCDSKRASRTHCRNGHEYTSESVRFTKTGKRVCISCERATRARHRPVKPCLRCNGPKDTGRKAKLCSTCREGMPPD